MDNGPNKRLKIEKKESLSTERSPPLPSSVNIILLIVIIVFLNVFLKFSYYVGDFKQN